MSVRQIILQSAVAALADGYKSATWEEFGRGLVYGIGVESAHLPINPAFVKAFHDVSNALREILRQQRIPAVLVTMSYFNDGRQEPETVHQAMHYLAIHGRKAAGVAVCGPGSLLLQTQRDLWMLDEQSRRKNFNSKLEAEVEDGFVIAGRFEELTWEGFRKRLEA